MLYSLAALLSGITQPTSTRNVTHVVGGADAAHRPRSCIAGVRVARALWEMLSLKSTCRLIATCWHPKPQFFVISFDIISP